jgi:hypothetical protein
MAAPPEPNGNGTNDGAAGPAALAALPSMLAMRTPGRRVRPAPRPYGT